MKKIFDKIVFGLFAGSFGFVAMLFIASAIEGGANVYFAEKTGEELLKTAVSFLVIGTGFSVPAVVYAKENISIGLQVLIHMAAGTIIFLITSFALGWVELDIGSILMYIIIAVVVAAVVWGIYMMGFRLQANRINEKIKEKQVQ